jgi:glyoxalase family protein
MSARVHGLHHVTAIAGEPRVNLEFYVGALGLRLVKKSVNQDAPDTYHLFYADAVGTPGTDLTFFPWPTMAPARSGAGHATEVLFGIPEGSLADWTSRLKERGVRVGAVETRFGERTLPFRDPHGLPLALVETDDDRAWSAWPRSPVPESLQLRGMHGVRLRVRDLGPTRALLEEVFGFEGQGDEDGWNRFAAPGAGSGALVEVRADPQQGLGRWGTGGVHHVAWHVRDDDEQMAIRARVEGMGLRPTPQIDRFWFRSVYFREPGGVLFELATEGPGFGRDEEMEHLGEKLILPPWLESRRSEIESALPPLDAAAARP